MQTVNLGLDPKHITGVQNGLITAVAAMGKPMVVVLEGGSVITMPWLANVPAVIMAWYPGQQGGRALGKLLFGKSNNWGKLPLSWAASEADLPEFANASGTTRMDYAIGYRWYDQNPTKQLLRTAATARPMGFGYGLSYSTFSYSNLQVPCSTVAQDGVVNVTVDVTNTSERPGDEIVFLFVVVRPYRLAAPSAQGAEGVQARQPGGAQPGRSRRGRRARQADHPAVAREGSEVLGHDGEQVGDRERRRARHRGAQRCGGPGRAGAARHCLRGRVGRRLRADRHLQGQLTCR